MNKKKVCIISKFIYDNDTRLQQQARVLNSAGARVDVICLRKYNHKKNILDGISIYGVVRPTAKETIFKYVLSTIIFSFAAFWKLQQLSFNGKFDLIVVHTLPESLIFVTIIQRIFGTKLLLDVRDTSVELFDSKWGKDKRKLLKLVIKFSANLACNFADRIITASSGFKEKLINRKIPETKITVFYNSADTSIFTYDHSRKFKKITYSAKLIYHGTIGERFGVDIAIQALALIQEQIPNSELNIYGFYDEDYKQKLKKLISELNIEKYVHLNERESLESISQKIKISDIGIVPYRNYEFMHLALSTKMFEYVASGIPVVAARLRSAEIVFTDDCISYCTPEKPNEFAEKIVKLCLDPDLRQTLVKNALEAHNKVSSDVMSKKYLEIVDELIG